MDVIKDNIDVDKKITKIFFKQSVKEIIDTQTTQSIKYVLNTIDLLVNDEDAKMKIRKAVLDNFNDLKRVYVGMMDSIVSVNKIHGKSED